MSPKVPPNIIKTAKTALFGTPSGASQHQARSPRSGGSPISEERSQKRVSVSRQSVKDSSFAQTPNIPQPASPVQVAKESADRDAADRVILNMLGQGSPWPEIEAQLKIHPDLRGQPGTNTLMHWAPGFAAMSFKRGNISAAATLSFLYEWMRAKEIDLQVGNMHQNTPSDIVRQNFNRSGYEEQIQNAIRPSDQGQMGEEPPVQKLATSGPSETKGSKIFTIDRAAAEK